MTQEDKDLLLKDLCARLPYGVNITWDETHEITCTPSIYNAIWLKGDTSFKLYLRPMSSMTEEEMSELSNLNSGLVFRKNIIKNIILGVYYKTDAIDWLNAHHFDYRGLIERGLALPAPENMYNIK